MGHEYDSSFLPGKEIKYFKYLGEDYFLTSTE
jgi:hypothetical protein